MLVKLVKLKESLQFRKCHNQTFLQLCCLGETPDENDLFPSTPLDEDQLKHYNAQEELGSVVINQINDGDQEMAWSDIPWSDPRYRMFNQSETENGFELTNHRPAI